MIGGEGGGGGGGRGGTGHWGMGWEPGGGGGGAGGSGRGGDRVYSETIIFRPWPDNQPKVVFK